MALIRRRGNSWSVVVRGPDGKQVRHTEPTKEQARQWAIKKEAEGEAGTWVDPSKAKVSFGKHAEECFAGASHLREGTRAKMRGHLDVHILPEFGTKPIGSITPAAWRPPALAGTRPDWMEPFARP